MIRADFLAGANLGGGDPNTFLHSMTRFFQFLPREQRHAFPQQVAEELRMLDPARPKRPRLQLDSANRVARDQI
jgi:hypothetical protein